MTAIPKHTDDWTETDWALWRANADWLDAYHKRRRAEAAAQPVKRKAAKTK